MEITNSFNLDTQIQLWRNRLGECPSISHEDLDELESHLREIHQELSIAGLSPEESFIVAGRRIGHPVELQDQYHSARPGTVIRLRIQWALLGILGYGVVIRFGGCLSSAVLWLGTGWEISGVALAYAALCLNGLFLVAGVIFARHRLAKKSGAKAPFQTLVTRPFNERRWLIMMSLTYLAGTVAWMYAQSAAAVVSHPTQLGGFTVVTASASFVCPLLLAVAILGICLGSKGRSLRQFTGLTTLLAGMLCLGCKPASGTATVPAPVPTADSSDATSSTAFEQCLKLAKTDVNSSVDAFLKLDLHSASLFTRGSTFGMSESEFIQFPRATMDAIHPKIIQDMEDLKKLARAVKERRDQAHSQNNTALVEKCNSQLTTLGAELQSNSHLKIVQLVGVAITKIATEKR